MSRKNRVLIVVEKGMIQTVYSNTKDLEFAVLDYDDFENDNEPDILMEDAQFIKNKFSSDIKWNLPLKEERYFKKILENNNW